MPYGLYISAEGATAQSKRMEVIANNLANVDAVGFKRSFAVVQARHSEAIDQKLDYAGSESINDIGGGVYVPETMTDFSPGTISNTGISTDMAIDGEGFFTIEKDGQQYLTRAGNFQLTDNRLTTQKGYSVLDRDGAPISIEATESSTIQQEIADRIGLVSPAFFSDLVNAGENLFSPLGNTTAVPAEMRNIRGGYLESSSVQPTIEMIEMIEASRAFEANVQLIRSQDQMLGQLVSRVLR